MKYLIISIYATLLMVSCNSIQDKQAENSQSTLEETDLSNSRKPKFVCTDEYMEVTKDTYNYYLKKLKHSGLLENLNGDVDETIQKKIKSDKIICFLSLTKYSEEENILIEPFQAEIDENIFNGLKNAIESQQVTKDEENIMFRLLDSGKDIYGNTTPYYYFKTVTFIKDIFFIRYSLTYLINIDGKPYSIVINTHDIEKDINNTILSINDISSNEKSSSSTQDENVNTKESIIWENNSNGLYSDSRDGKNYNVINIGNQIWFAENLAHIPSNHNYSDEGIWIYNVKNEKNQDAVSSDNYKTYGCLYNWTTAKKICPDGWYLPSDSDWNKLEIYAREQDEKNPGGILKTIPEWDSPNVGANNSIGFAAKPGGDYRIHYKQFYDIGKLANFWSSTPLDVEYAWARTLSYKNGEIYRESWLKGHGFSVRCIKNKITNPSYKQQDSKNSNNNYQLTSEQSEDKIIFLDGIKVSKSLIVNSCLDYTKKEGLDELIIPNYSLEN